MDSFFVTTPPTLAGKNLLYEGLHKSLASLVLEWRKKKIDGENL